MKQINKTVNLIIKALRLAGLTVGLAGLMGLSLFSRPLGAEETGRPEISFYHWRTVYDPGPESLKRLKELQAGRLYLRFFEVTSDERGRPVPRATAIFRQKPHLPVVPVIFLENSVFSGPVKAEDLAAKLWARVIDMAEVNGLKLAPELHLDCDWTRSTRAAFFEFCQALHNQMPRGWELAVTLRLDQFKNHRLTGVPPAGRGVLMAYNLGDIKRPGPGNSIIDPRLLKPYLTGKRPYPLPLDLALPLFSWAVVFDERNQYRGLLSPIPEQLNSLEYCRPVGGGMYTVVKPFASLGGRLLPRAC